MLFSFNFDKIKNLISIPFKWNKKNSPTVKESVVAGDVVGRDKVHVEAPQNNGQLSKIEKQALKVIHKRYNETGRPNVPIKELYSVLEIPDGTWVGPLNDSKVLKIDGEDIAMTTDGVRFMDNISESDLRNVVLPTEQRELDRVMEIQRRKFEENQRRNRKPFPYIYKTL